MTIQFLFIVAGLEQLDEDTCERAFEYFESICYDKLSERKMNDSILGIEFDEDSVCDVCQAVCCLQLRWLQRLDDQSFMPNYIFISARV